MDQRINMKLLYLSCAVLAWGLMTECSGYSDGREEVERLYSKYDINRDIEHVSALTNHDSSIFFEFEIPQRRQFYCATFTSNVVIVTLHDKNGISRHRNTDIDMELLKSFQQKLLGYKYEPLSVTTGPKYVYVTILSPQNRCYKFDYPWWISSHRSDIPSGMLLGLDICVSDLYRNYTTIFGKYIFPNMMKLQGKRHVMSKMHHDDRICQ